MLSVLFVIPESYPRRFFSARRFQYPTLISGGDSFKNDVTFKPKLKYDCPLSNILKMVVA